MKGVINIQHTGLYNNRRLIRVIVVPALMISAFLLGSTLLSSSYALHIPNQTAIMDPTFADITDPIRNSTSLTNTSLPPMTQLTNGIVPDSVVSCVDYDGDSVCGTTNTPDDIILEEAASEDSRGDDQK
jgi:hypothetical protein